MTRLADYLAGVIIRYPWWLVAVVLGMTVAAVPGLTMLRTDTSFNAFVSPDAPVATNTARYQAVFGGEPVYILMTAPVEYIFTPGNLDKMSRLHDYVGQDDRFRSVIGPLNVLELAIQQAGGEPSLDNQDFINSVIYTDAGEISPAMKPFVPDTHHALIIITPEGDLSNETTLQTTKDIEAWLEANPLVNNGTAVISSARLIEAISDTMSTNMIVLLALAIVVMVIILLALFRVRWRLLSLIIALISLLWTFGLMGYLGVPMTMATMAVLPILIGLGIDFSIQFHNRYQEEVTRCRTVGEAMANSIKNILPVIIIALLATIAGFITLFISPVPMIKDFGMMLAIGILVNFILGLFMLNGVVILGDRRAEVTNLKKASFEASGRIERILGRIGRLAVNQTLWIIVVAVAFAVGGAVADQRLPVNTDYEELIPQDTPALAQLRELREIGGGASIIRIMVEADDVTAPEVLMWMKQYGDTSLGAHAELLNVDGPAVLVSRAAGGVIPGPEQIGAILAGTPGIYLEPLLSADHGTASMSFSVTHISLEDLNELLKQLDAEAKPPEGVRVSQVGSTVLGARTIDDMIGSRMTLNFICLGAILVILLAVYRRIGQTVFSIAPVGAVLAWSSLDMYLIGIPLNPLTAIMGVIVIGICTEFMVMLTGRYEEEKASGLAPREAMVTAIAKIGRAIVTTAVTTLGGFGVLIASNFVMIRDFGIATVVGVFLCLIIVITVMPGIIVHYDEWRERRAARRGKV